MDFQIVLRKQSIKTIASEIVQKIEKELKEKGKAELLIYLLPLQYDLSRNNFYFILKIVEEYFKNNGFEVQRLSNKMIIKKKEKTD